jgi:division protein CdvB (Snf7/Vps24/ESCRT-III family)
MGKRNEINERVMRVASLRRKKMQIADIARFLSISERQVYKDLNRAQQLYKLLITKGESEKLLGERLNVFVEMEQEALAKFASMDPKTNVALGYLNAARDAGKEIKKLLQEAGMITKVPEQLDLTPGIPFEDPEVRAAYYQFLKIARAKREKK